MDVSTQTNQDDEIIIATSISELDARIPALKHQVGNEYEMNWKSVWIHGKTGSVRILETSTGMTVQFMPNR